MTGKFFGNLEVDLRLSDAEYALQHYNNLVKKRKFFDIYKLNYLLP
ncbi:hypothetical protein PN502_06990 [Microcystis aeruginosa CS-338/01]|nr:hypothetical protein [Microcystis aeruginosa]MDB9506841.1 hypothetical protein [Microcystis aeruginosa CS-338/01]